MCKQQQHTSNNVQTQNPCVEDPQIVKVLNDLLELRWDIYRNVMVEAGLNAELVWQRRPIVSSDARCVTASQKFSFAALEFGCFSFELFLTSLK